MPPLPLWSRTLLVVAVATTLGVGAVWLRFEHPRDRTGLAPGVLPACDSPFARKLLKQTIEEAPAAHDAGLRILRLGAFRHNLDSARETTQLPVRVCEADVFANAGRRALDFSLEWTGTDKNEVWLSVPQLPW